MELNYMGEELRPVSKTNLNGITAKFLVSRNGKIIINCVTNKIIKPSLNGSYLRVKVQINKCYVNVFVHELVYRAWVNTSFDRLKSKTVIDHIDNNTLNNDYTNLQELTCSENNKKSTRRYRSLSDDVVEKLFIDLFIEKMSLTKASLKYNILRSSVYHFRKTNRYKSRIYLLKKKYNIE